MVPVFSDLVSKSFTFLALQLMAELTLLPEVWATGLNLCAECDLEKSPYGVPAERMRSASCGFCS